MTYLYIYFSLFFFFFIFILFIFYISFRIFWPITTFYSIYFLLKRKRMVSVFPTGYDWWIHFHEFCVRDHFLSYASRFTRAICEPVLQFSNFPTGLHLRFNSVGGSAQIRLKENENNWDRMYDKKISMELQVIRVNDYFICTSVWVWVSAELWSQEKVENYKLNLYRFGLKSQNLNSKNFEAENWSWNLIFFLLFSAFPRFSSIFSFLLSIFQEEIKP